MVDGFLIVYLLVFAAGGAAGWFAHVFFGKYTEPKPPIVIVDPGPLPPDVPPSEGGGSLTGVRPYHNGE